MSSQEAKFRLIEPVLADLGSMPFPYDFTFVINKQSYRCHLLQVVAVSELIFQQVQQKKQPSEFVFSDLLDPHRYFNLFMDLLKGEKIEVTFENSFFLNKIATILKIPSLEAATRAHTDYKITDQNAVSITRILSEHGLDYAEPGSYIARNFERICHLDSLMDLSVEVLSNIISMEGFTVHSESEFFEWIEKLVNTRGRAYNELFGHVQFHKLRRHHMKHLLDLISYDEISPFVWQELDERLECDIINDSDSDSDYDADSFEALKPVAPIKPAAPATGWAELGSLGAPQPTPDFDSEEDLTESEDDSEDVIDIGYEEQYQLQGAISYLQDTYPDEWTSFVRVTGGGTKVRKLTNILDLDDTRTSWWDNFDSNMNQFKRSSAWVQIELTGYALDFQAYTLASPANRASFHQPKGWRIEVSTDGQRFEVVQTINGCPAMNHPFPIESFVLQREAPMIRFVRLILLENFATNPQNTWELSLSAFEIFGRLHKL